jgi:hypothetical protein
MSETTNVTKQFLDKDGLDALWNKICSVFASKDELNNIAFSDTKNTTGATNTNSKIYLVGATSQSDNPITYSHDTAYVGSDGYLYSNSKKVNMDIVPTLVKQGNEIPENADLNTTEYLKVGIYTCIFQSTAITLKNSPVTNAFRMEVFSLQSSNISDGIETSAGWVYRLRKIIRLSGEQYFQLVSSDATAGNFIYGDWYYIPTVKATIDTTDINGSTIAVGNSTTPVFINSSGKFEECSDISAVSVSTTVISTSDALDNFLEVGKVKFGQISSSAALSVPALAGKDGFVISHCWSNSKSYGAQFAYDDGGYNVSFRYKTSTWSQWKALSFEGHTHDDYLLLSGGTLTGQLDSRSIVPTSTNTYNLGTNSLKWSNVYATNFIGNIGWDYIQSKPIFATVATSGSYNDLSDKPTIPVVNIITTDMITNVWNEVWN